MVLGGLITQLVKFQVRDIIGTASEMENFFRIMTMERSNMKGILKMAIGSVAGDYSKMMDY